MRPSRLGFLNWPSFGPASFGRFWKGLGFPIKLNQKWFWSRVLAISGQRSQNNCERLPQLFFQFSIPTGWPKSGAYGGLNPQGCGRPPLRQRNPYRRPAFTHRFSNSVTYLATLAQYLSIVPSIHICTYLRICSAIYLCIRLGPREVQI